MELDGSTGGGNAIHNATFLAHFPAGGRRPMKGCHPNDMKEFVKEVYIDLRYHDPNGQSAAANGNGHANGHAAHAPASKPASVPASAPRLASSKSAPLPPTASADLLGDLSGPSPGSDWTTFSSAVDVADPFASSPTGLPSHTNGLGTTNGFGSGGTDFSAFSSAPAAVPSSPPGWTSFESSAPVTPSSPSGFGAFAAAPAPPAFDAFAAAPTSSAFGAFGLNGGATMASPPKAATDAFSAFESAENETGVSAANGLSAFGISPATFTMDSKPAPAAAPASATKSAPMGALKSTSNGGAANGGPMGMAAGMPAVAPGKHISTWDMGSVGVALPKAGMGMPAGAPPPMCGSGGRSVSMPPMGSGMGMPPLSAGAIGGGNAMGGGMGMPAGAMPPMCGTVGGAMGGGMRPTMGMMGAGMPGAMGGGMGGGMGMANGMGNGMGNGVGHGMGSGMGNGMANGMANGMGGSPGLKGAGILTPEPMMKPAVKKDDILSLFN